METYSQRLARTHTWIARHVCQDLLLMHGAQATVFGTDESLIRKAEAKDAALATLPPERALFTGGSGRNA